MEIKAVVIVFLCITCLHVAFQEEEQCSLLVLRNSTDPTIVSFYDRLEKFIEERKMVKPISDYLNTGKLNVSALFSIDYHSANTTIKPGKIIMQTDSNYSDPDFFVAKYRDAENATINMLLLKIKKILQKQNFINGIYNIILTDETIKNFLNKLFRVKSLMNIHITVTSQEFHINYIEIYYVGKEDCFPTYMMYKDNTNQRHKRNTQTKQDEILLRKLQNHNRGNKPTIFEQGLPVLTREDIHRSFQNIRLPNNRETDDVFTPDRLTSKRSNKPVISDNDNLMLNDDYAVRRSVALGDEDCSEKRAFANEAGAYDNDAARRSVAPGDEDCSVKKAFDFDFEFDPNEEYLVGTPESIGYGAFANEADAYDDDAARKSVAPGDEDCSEKRAFANEADACDDEAARRSVAPGDEDCSEKRAFANEAGACDDEAARRSVAPGDEDCSEKRALAYEADPYDDYLVGRPVAIGDVFCSVGSAARRSVAPGDEDCSEKRAIANEADAYDDDAARRSVAPGDEDCSVKRAFANEAGACDDDGSSNEKAPKQQNEANKRFIMGDIFHKAIIDGLANQK